MVDRADMRLDDARRILDERFDKVYLKRDDGTDIKSTGKWKHKRGAAYRALECALETLEEVREILLRHELPGKPVWLNGTTVDELIAEALSLIPDDPNAWKYP